MSRLIEDMPEEDESITNYSLCLLCLNHGCKDRNYLYNLRHPDEVIESCHAYGKGGAPYGSE